MEWLRELDLFSFGEAQRESHHSLQLPEWDLSLPTCMQ